MKGKWLIQLCVLCMFLLTFAAGVQANSAQEQEIRNAFKEAKEVQQVGPKEVTLLDQATIKLPPHYIYVPQPQAGKIMKSMGNTENPSMIGLIFSDKDNENWMVMVKYEKSGYIKDDDAKNWNVEELFTSIKEGTEEANKERQKNGFPELEIVGWVEKPQYNAERHHLVWSLAGKTKGAPETKSQIINYNTYNLGREGYLTLTLLTNQKDIEATKPVVAKLLDNTEYVSGKRYEDFSASTDKIAEYGLAALVAGVAAKKLGLFAIAAAFVLKFAKIIALAIFGGGGLLMKLFRRKRKEDAPKTGAGEE